MDFLRAGKEGTVLFPWAEPTAGHVMEALDRTDDVPLLIPIHTHVPHVWQDNHQGLLGSYADCQ